MEPIINTDDLYLLRLLPNDVERARVNCALFWEMGISDDHIQGFLADEHNFPLIAEIKGQPAGLPSGDFFFNYSFAYLEINHALPDEKIA